MESHKHNPIGYVHGNNRLSADPFEFQDTIEIVQRKQLRKFQKFLNGKFPTKYGLSKHGYTLADRGDFLRFLHRKKKPLPKKWEVFDGALLTTKGGHAAGRKTKKSDMDCIMRCDGDWNTAGLQHVGELYWDNFDFTETQAELDKRMKVVLNLLRNEIDSVAHDLYFKIAKKPAPFIFNPRKSGYTGGPYHVFPITFYLTEDFFEITR